MEIVAAKRIDRRTEYSRRNKTTQATYMRTRRAAQIPEFIGVDSEGIGRGLNHRAVLLGVGTDYTLANDMKAGLHWTEVFEFLYAQFKKHPKAAFVGFFLGYDMNFWLRYLPTDAKRMLLTEAGKALRLRKGDGKYRNTHYPVRVDGWELDMMGMKRLSIRPRPEGCKCPERRIKCTHKQAEWMHICDAGSFFQMSFLGVIDPEKWTQDPDGNVCSPDEYAKVLDGKNSRGDFTRVTKKMIEYNGLENVILARVMDRLARAFAQIGIRLPKDQWYGPGASAANWLRSNGGVKRNDVTTMAEDWFLDACRMSYYGGWFEIFSHGKITGTSWNYDINNAYPYAITKLPHLCDECAYERGEGAYRGKGEFVLLHCTVKGKGRRIGPAPYRDKSGNILRPYNVKGWYWQHEIQAAKRAGLVSELTVHEWQEIIPCDHPRPYKDEVERLYYLRLEKGKNSALGMAIKLNNNSIYGKFAQSVGSAPYNNWFYASYITSHCRTQILNAIATHPGKADSVLMVATDGILFDSRHPSLVCSKKLGEWDDSKYEDVILFKPGVYWHRVGVQQLLKAKTRGVPKAEFEQQLTYVEARFDRFLLNKEHPTQSLSEDFLGENLGLVQVYNEMVWPFFMVPVNFRMKSCKQALNEGHPESSCEIQEKFWLLQDSDPHIKRRSVRVNPEKRRLDTLCHKLPESEWQTHYYQEVPEPITRDLGIGFEGDAIDVIGEAIGLMHDGFDPENVEWETVWEG